MLTTELTRPDAIARLVPLATDGLTSPHSRRAYARALRHYCDWHLREGWPRLSRASVQAWLAASLADGTSAASANQALSAIKRLVREAAHNGLLEHDVAAGIAAIEGIRQRGVRLGNWLDRATAERMLALPDPATLAGKRDRVLLGLLLGCGLRRQEAATLLLEQVQARDGRPLIVDLLSKGGRVRTVPMPAWVRTAIEAWVKAAGVDGGRLLRPVNKGDKLAGDSMGAAAVYAIVHRYAERLGLQLAPHDLRRTFAKLAWKGEAKLDSIQVALGHAQLATTQRYLGTGLDLQDAACDHLGVTP